MSAFSSFTLSGRRSPVPVPQTAELAAKAAAAEVARLHAALAAAATSNAPQPVAAPRSLLVGLCDELSQLTAELEQVRVMAGAVEARPSRHVHTFPLSVCSSAAHCTERTLRFSRLFVQSEPLPLSSAQRLRQNGRHERRPPPLQKPRVKPSVR